MTMIPTYVILGILLLFLLVSSLKSFGINQEYQRGVLFRLGRLGPMKGPGWYWLIPYVDRVVRVDMRTITYQLETQETITRDGVAVRVNAVLWFRADAAVHVVTSVENWMSATVQAAANAHRDWRRAQQYDHRDAPGRARPRRAQDRRAASGRNRRGLSGLIASNRRFTNARIQPPAGRTHCPRACRRRFQQQR